MQQCLRTDVQLALQHTCVVSTGRRDVEYGETELQCYHKYWDSHQWLKCLITFEQLILSRCLKNSHKVKLLSVSHLAGTFRGSVVNVIMPLRSAALICQRNLHSFFLLANGDNACCQITCCSGSVDNIFLSIKSLFLHCTLLWLNYFSIFSLERSDGKKSSF